MFVGRDVAARVRCVVMSRSRELTSRSWRIPPELATKLKVESALSDQPAEALVAEAIERLLADRARTRREPA